MYIVLKNTIQEHILYELKKRNISKLALKLLVVFLLKN